MGQQLFGKNISIVDDVYHPFQLGAPFDGEGMPRQRVSSGGKRCAQESSLLTRQREKAGRKPDRPRLRLPNEYGEAPMNLVFGGGDSSVEKMVAAPTAACL
jgi:hypothetical protein